MLEIDNTLISFDLIQCNFTCDLSVCRGACCVTGDSGAPLEPEEAAILKEIFNSVRPFLSEKSVETIKKTGTSVIDMENDLVTPLNDGRECAYTIFENGIAYCGIEKAYNLGVTVFRKPVSCYLYPVRIKRYKRFDAVNYHRWDICHPAVQMGDKLKTPVYCFAKNALIQRFGESWYNALSAAAAEPDIINHIR